MSQFKGAIYDRKFRIEHVDKPLELRGRSYLLQRGPYVMDHFVGDTLDANLWSTSIDTGDTAAAIDVQVGGVIRAATAATNNNRSSIAGEIIWRPNKGGLVLEARVAGITAVTSVRYLVGLTDAKAEAAQTLPASIAGSTLTTTASDGAFWLFDTGQTGAEWSCFGVKADTDTTVSKSGTAATAGTFVIVRIEIDAAGHANFYLDDAFVARKENAVTASGLLVPFVGVQTLSAAARTLDVDYIFCAQAL